MTQIQEPITEVEIDIVALRERYRVERDKRIRGDGTKQYVYTDQGAFAEFGRDPWVEDVAPRDTVHDEVDVTIIGAGFGGLVGAANLRKAGLKQIRNVDPAGDFGGTWYWNRYPGVACDVESYLYLPMLEEVGGMPSRKYAPGEEIRQHAIKMAKHFDLYRDALFQTEVSSVSWSDETQRWTVKTNRGDEYLSRYVVLSTGPFQRPKVPNLPGALDFKGKMMHTSRWDYDFTGGDATGGLDKLADKRVALIGTGATSIQLVPHLAKAVKELFVIQRTPSSVDVRGDEETDPEWFNSLTPGWQKIRRDNWVDHVHGLGMQENLVGDRWTDLGPVRGMKALVASGFAAEPMSLFELEDAKKMNELRARVSDIVTDPTTAAALQPWYSHLCKRPAFSDKYLQAFNEENVHLVNSDGAGIERFTENGIVVQGIEYPVDVIIYGTGYESNRDVTTQAGADIRGRDGVSLSEYWADGFRTLHGLASHGFPNLLHLGLNQNAYSFNYIHIMEEQAEHLAKVVTEAESRGTALIEPTVDAESAWIALIQAQDIAASEAFNASCTPGYYNAEGAPASRNELFVGGTVAFNALLGQWVEAGGMDEMLTQVSPRVSTPAAPSSDALDERVDMFENANIRVIGSGLKFPEAPVVAPDGSIYVGELEGFALVRVDSEGVRTVVAEPGAGGVNGAAFGPDGALYIGSNGGFVFITDDAGNRAPIGVVEGYVGGSIHRVDPATGEFTELFTQSGGEQLGGLNDIVFDADGGAYVADTGTGRIHYMVPAAGTIAVAASGLITPNGLGLSPDGSKLYASETYTGRVRAYAVAGAGQLTELPDLYQHDGGDGPEGAMFWDGLAVDGAGNVVVADLRASGIRAISPEGVNLGVLKTTTPDGYVTCLCFGGEDGNTVYITSGGRGLLYAAEWPFSGGRLNFQP